MVQRVGYHWNDIGLDGLDTGLAVVRGGGDLATGVIQKLWRGGFRVVVLETPKPTAIRRTVSLSSAVQEGVACVEDMRACLISRAEDCEKFWQAGEVPVLVDPTGESLAVLRPAFLVDAIIAKKNLGTHLGMAPITVALGPGFTAPEEVDAVIETMRGHDLGRLITRGNAMPNTGVPGLLGGKTGERVVHSPASGLVTHRKKIGDRVEKGEPLFLVGNTEVYSPLTGTLRGLIAEGLEIPKGMKSADIDPRTEDEVDFKTISDKARCLGGAVLEACLYFGRQWGISINL